MLALVLYTGLSIVPDPRRVDPEAAIRPASSLEPPPAPDSTMPPAKTFVEIVRRPIFSPTREPAPQGEVTIESFASELDLKLVGIIIASGKQIAIVSPRNRPTFVRLSEGDRFRGWSVERIEPHRVMFRRNDVAEFIELNYDQPPPKKPAKKQQKTTQEAKKKKSDKN